MSGRYQRLRETADGMGERKDCSVIATAIVLDKDYQEVRQEFLRQGRKPNRSTNFSITQLVLFRYGMQATNIPAPAKTLVTLGRLGMQGRYLVRVSRHIAAMVDSVIHDWTQGRRHRIQFFYVVEPYGTKGTYEKALGYKG